MAKLRIQGDSTGYVDLEAPTNASSSTLDLDQVPQKNQSNTFHGNQSIESMAIQDPNEQSTNSINFGHANNGSWGVSNAIMGRTNDITWALGSNGTRHYMGVGSQGGGTFKTVLEMTTDGHLLTPFNPYATASCATTTSATSIIPLNSSNMVRGGMSIDNTNNRIIVPVGGAYIVGYQHLGNSGSGNCQVNIRKNGATIWNSYNQETASANDSFSKQIIVEMSANDYFDFVVNQGAVHGNAQYNIMYAYLLG